MVRNVAEQAAQIQARRRKGVLVHLATVPDLRINLIFQESARTFRLTSLGNGMRDKFIAAALRSLKLNMNGYQSYVSPDFRTLIPSLSVLSTDLSNGTFLRWMVTQESEDLGMGDGEGKMNWRPNGKQSIQTARCTAGAVWIHSGINLAPTTDNIATFSTLKNLTTVSDVAAPECQNAGPFPEEEVEESIPLWPGSGNNSRIWQEIP
ncbi:hypothetical protein MMC30_006565 [Trapelia coarctata]|nr:hypothetical protein [Trapelia coarctata]